MWVSVLRFVTTPEKLSAYNSVTTSCVLSAAFLLPTTAVLCPLVLLATLVPPPMPAPCLPLPPLLLPQWLPLLRLLLPCCDASLRWFSSAASSSCLMMLNAFDPVQPSEPNVNKSSILVECHLCWKSRGYMYGKDPWWLQ